MLRFLMEQRGLRQRAIYHLFGSSGTAVVVPIFGLFIVSSSIAGAILFGEILTTSRILELSALCQRST
jgi:hypothetical protein